MTRFTAIITALLVASASIAFATPTGYDYKPPCKQCISSPNNCDITAPCSSFGSKLYCGCRPGYKASTNYISDYDVTKQWRIDVLPGHEHRVWVAPGVKCDTLCQFPFGSNPCGEVAVADQCFY